MIAPNYIITFRTNKNGRWDHLVSTIGFDGPVSIIAWCMEFVDSEFIELCIDGSKSIIIKRLNKNQARTVI